MIAYVEKVYRRRSDRIDGKVILGTVSEYTIFVLSFLIDSYFIAVKIVITFRTPLYVDMSARLR